MSMMDGRYQIYHEDQGHLDCCSCKLDAIRTAKAYSSDPCMSIDYIYIIDHMAHRGSPNLFGFVDGYFTNIEKEGR